MGESRSVGVLVVVTVGRLEPRGCGVLAALTLPAPGILKAGFRLHLFISCSSLTLGAFRLQGLSCAGACHRAFPCPRLPYLLVARMSKQADANNDAAFKCQSLLGFDELLLEACTATWRDYIVALNHTNQFLKFQNPVPVSGSNFRVIAPPIVGRSSISAV